MVLRRALLLWFAVGLSDDFCSIAQEEGLDDHMVDLVSRLGRPGGVFETSREMSPGPQWRAKKRSGVFVSSRSASN